MRAGRVRHSALAAAAAVVLTPLLPQVAAHAATAKPTVYPLVSAVPGLTSADQMVEAKGKLYISVPGASEVKVITTSGTVATTITGLKGASGLAVAADGSDVFVALTGSDRIGVIDTTSLQEVGSFSLLVDTHCPTSLAVASGRIFYSYGCADEAADTAGVASINATTLDDPEAAVSGLAGAGLLRSHGNNLAVTDGGSTVSTYLASNDGSVTKEGTATVDNTEDLAFTSTGEDLLVATSSPYQISSFATATMTANPVSYPGVAYPQAVAADPKGTYVAAGFRSAATTAELYTQSSGAVQWARFTASADPSTWVSGRSDDAVQAQTLTFSTTGGNVFGLVKHAGTKDLYLFDSTVKPTASKVTLTIPHVGFGRPHTATSKGPGGVPVEFLLKDAGTTKDLGTVPANTAGIAHITFTAPYNGSVEAVVLGSPSNLPATHSTAFHVVAMTAYRLLGAHKLEHGIAVYSSVKAVKVEFSTSPAQASRPTVTRVQRLVHHHWRTTQTLHGVEKYDGVKIYFKSAPKHVELRVRLTVPADSDSGASSATSRPIEIS